MSKGNQRKLASEEAEKVGTAFLALKDLSFFNHTSDGVDYWLNVCGKLAQMLCTHTTDGEPWVEPERWRVPTDEDARLRPKCRVRDDEDKEWQQATLFIVEDNPNDDCPFYARLNDGEGEVFDWWYYCEILDNENKNRVTA